MFEPRGGAAIEWQDRFKKVGSRLPRRISKPRGNCVWEKVIQADIRFLMLEIEYYIVYLKEEKWFAVVQTCHAIKHCNHHDHKGGTPTQRPFSILTAHTNGKENLHVTIPIR